MAGLPPKPEVNVYEPRRFAPPPDDRRYVPIARPERMAPHDRYSQYPRPDADWDHRERGDRSNYPPRSPPRARVGRDSYGAPTYDARDGARYSEDYHGQRHRDEHARRAWTQEPPREWEANRAWDSRPRHHDEWRGDSRRGYDRDNFDRRRGGGRDYGRPRMDDRRRRDNRFGNWRDRSPSVSPRRKAPSIHAPRSDHRRSRSPTRSQSPRRRDIRQRSRSHSRTSKSASHTTSPRSRGQLHSHPASVVSRSPAHIGHGETHNLEWEGSGHPQRYSRSVSRSRDARPLLEPSHQDAGYQRTGYDQGEASIGETSSALQVPLKRESDETRDTEMELKPNNQSGVKSESEDETLHLSAVHQDSDTVPHEPSRYLEKGKLKEEPPDYSLSWRNRSPSPSNNLRGVHAPRGRSPPRGPRNYVKTPTTPLTPALPLPSNLPPHSSPDYKPVVDQPAPILTLPHIPRYQPKPSITAEQDAEITKIEARRANLNAEYSQLSKATRRAQHELEIAAIDLRAAENRRKLAESHLDKAKAGALGIDFVAVPV